MYIQFAECLLKGRSLEISTSAADIHQYCNKFAVKLLKFSGCSQVIYLSI